MHLNFALAAPAAASLLLASYFQSSPPAEAAVRVPVAVVHGGDAALIERLKLAGEVWHDAGDFLVGALWPADVATLGERGVSVQALVGLGATDELFIVDLEHSDVHADVDAAGRIEFRRGEVALVSVPHGLTEYPESLRPGRTCHSGHTAITRHAMRPIVAPVVQGLPLSGGSAPLLGGNSRIQTLVNQVSQTNLQTWVQSYSSYTNRDSQNLANFNAGKAQLIAQLQGYGYTPVSESWSGTHGTNIVVDIPGVVNPNRFVVVGAHFDTRNNAGGVNAVGRGADDNTSGSAAVLELARILSTAGAFENSIRLVWFSGEEYGLLGSNANATNMVNQGKQVIGMLNMDMISYRVSTDARDCDFATNNTSAALTSFCQQTCPLYVPNWASTSGTLSAGSSDHASYNSAGIPAAFFFEDLTQYFPQIHTSADAYPTSTNDFVLAKMICQGVLACAATLADPVDLVLAHTELPDTTDASGPYVVDANITSLYGSTITGATLRYRLRGAANWTSAVMSNVSGSTWRASIPALGSPATIEYYVEGVDDQGASEVAPKGADLGALPYDFFVGVRTVIYATGFEEGTDNGWTHAQVATQDDWQRGALFGKAGDPTAAFAGTRAWGNDLGPTGWNGFYTNSVNNWLRSPSIDCSSASQVFLEFRRWLTVESGQFDQARIRVNGQLVWSNPTNSDLIDSSWIPVQLDISAIAGANPAVQVEFSLQSDAGVTFGGWTIDAFAVVKVEPGTLSCPAASSYCTAKVNSQGCSPQIASTGQASATSPAPFLVSASQVINQKAGVLFYGYSSGASAFQGAFKCVGGAVIRTQVQSSGGNTGFDDCSGALSYDFNARIQSGADPALIAGVDVFAQWWYRDGADPAGYGTGLSNGLQFRVCP